MSKKTIVVGMSGGVDSSVAAWLLKREGHHVIGMFMRNWEEDGICPAAIDYEDVVNVCGQIGIPHYVINFSREYWKQVFSPCLEEFREGHTPNPDILCNREIKFNLLYEKARELGADYLATGHYVRILHCDENVYLARGKDAEKDQSYFLYTLKSKILRSLLFPVGELTKKQVRSIASENGLCTANKKDSTGICFIGKRNFKEFLTQYIPTTRGNFETLRGEIVGEHDGIAHYTIGQRKGLAIGGKGDAWFVVGKDSERNVVLVEQGAEHPSLQRTRLLATDLSWVNDPPISPFSCAAKIRYRARDALCTLNSSNENEIEVVFDTPQKAITPRQSIVFYQGDVCLGGAMIAS